MKTNAVIQQRLAFLGATTAAFVAASTPLVATELLQNNSFDRGSNHWHVTSAATTNLFATLGQVNLHISGYTGNVINQDLDATNMAYATVEASLTLTRNLPVAGNTIAAYLHYTDTGGLTNRLPLLNPDNLSISNATVVSTNFLLPSDALRIVRFDVDKEASGNFDLLEASLNVTPYVPPGPKPDPSLHVRNLSDQPPGEPWEDLGNQLAIAGQTVHVAWVSQSGVYPPLPEPNLRTNRLYYRRSLDGGQTFQTKTMLLEMVGIDRQNRISDGAGRTWLAVDGDNVHILCRHNAYWDGASWSQTQLWYYRSTDGGATFEPARYLGGALTEQYIYEPIIVASQGKVTLAYEWTDALTGYNLYVINSPDNGTNWVLNVVANPGVGGVWLADLKRTGDQVCVTWVDSYNATTWAGGSPHVACSTNGGTNFTATRLAEAQDYQTGYYCFDPPIMATAGRNVYVIYANENTNLTPAGPYLFFRRSTNDGVTFSEPLNLSYGRLPTNETATLDRSFIAAQGSNVLVTLLGSLNNAYLARSTDAGQSFLPSVQLLNYGWSGYSPVGGITRTELLIDPANPSRVHAFWGGEFYRLSTTAGQSWVNTVQISLPYSPLYLMGSPVQVGLDSAGVFHFNGRGFISGAPRIDADVWYRRFNLTAPAFGPTNQALYLTQDQSLFRYDNLQIPAGHSLDVSNAVSVETWVRLELGEFKIADFLAKLGVGTTDEWPAILLGMSGYDWGSEPWDRWFQAYIHTTDGGFLVNGTGARIYDNEWHHVAFTYNAAAGADNLRLYVDGELNATATATGQLLQGRKPLMIGPAATRIMGSYFTGQLDDLRLWDRALTATEIRDRFTGPLVGNEPGLIAYYPFDGSTKEATGKGMDGVPMYQEAFGAGADTQPLLKIEHGDGQRVTLSWLTFGATYTPKSTTDLGSPVWQPVPGTPTLVNGRWTLTVSADRATQFFRLQR
jgi:hypothetical protein